MSLSLTEALTPLILFHAFRHVGMTMLVPVVVDSNVPREFSVPLAYGDLATALLAVASVVMLRWRVSGAVALVWIFNVVGTADLLNAMYQGVRLDITRYQLGAAWYIPTFYVPALLVTHVMIFALLVRRAR